MTSRRSILILLGLCQLFCAIALVNPGKIFYILALIAFVLGLLEAATTDERSYSYHFLYYPLRPGIALCNLCPLRGAPTIFPSLAQSFKTFIPILRL